MYLREVEISIGQNRIERLYITDDLQEANRLKGIGAPVLIYLHEGNRQQDFSSFHYAVENPEEVDAVFAERVVRRHMDLPWKILETNRCIVRETVESDAEAIVTMYLDEEVAKYMPPLPASIEELRDIITAYREEIYRLYEFGIWTVIEKATGQVIGRAGLEMKEEGPELGYMFDVSRRNQGYATEVCKAILRYAKEELGIDKVVARVKSGNKTSLSVCRKLGFFIKKTERKTEMVKNLESKDLIIFTKSF